MKLVYNMDYLIPPKFRPFINNASKETTNMLKAGFAVARQIEIQTTFGITSPTKLMHDILEKFIEYETEGRSDETIKQ